MLKQAIIDTFNFHRGYIQLLTMDIPDERMTEQPGGDSTHPAWQLGHMAHSLDGFAAMLGVEKRLDSWKEQFGQGSQPTSNRADYPSKEELLTALDERREALVEAVRNAPDSAFEQPHPDEDARKFFPTVGHFLLFGMLSHDGMHCGQLATWRRCAGMCEALSNIDKLAQPAEA